MYREDGSADRSVLVASLNGRVFGFDAVTGERRWEHRVGGVHVELLVEEDRVFAAAADAQRLVAAAAAQVLRTESPAKPRAGRPPRPESPAAIAARVVTAKRSPGADDAYPKYSVSEKTYDL